MSVHGTVAPGFEPVRAAFEENFARRSELGAACAIHHRGEPVVDLWGGWQDRARTRPWAEDTLVLTYSVSKGISALAMAMAHARGWFALDEPVAAYWPEFAAAGKEAVTVRQLLSHQAGLAALDVRLDAARIADVEQLGAGLAAQRPHWPPGKRHGYHGITLGWYQSELLRRVDPQGRRLARFVREEIAAPLEGEFHIGLPQGVPTSRVADIVGIHPATIPLHLRTLPTRMVFALLSPWSLTTRAMRNPRFTNPADLDAPAYRAVEMPASNGFGTARLVARAFGLAAEGGRALGLDGATFEAISAPPSMPSAGPRDAVLKVDTAYTFGFSRPAPGFPFGTGPRTFGAPGVGGALAFADPDARIGYAFLLNRLGARVFDDPRERAVRTACYRCLDAAAQGA
jgi:CubicO group peptidase (beta-lactamase class C family)